MAAFRVAFSRPVNSESNPAPSSSSAATRPHRPTLPAVGVMVPAIIWSRVLLPDPFSPTIPKLEPCLTWKLTSFSAQKSRW